MAGESIGKAHLHGETSSDNPNNDNVCEPSNKETELKKSVENDDNDDDEAFLLDDNPSADGVFDARKFFSTVSFPDKVLEVAKEQIYKNIEEPLSLLEQEGYELLASYQRDLRAKLLEEKEQGDRMVQKTLDDLLVKGDPREYQRLLFETAVRL